MKIVQEALYSLLSILWINCLQIAVIGSFWVLNVAIREWSGIDVMDWLKKNWRKHENIQR